jgi:NhaP-type Na+/H+ or K+/H+ antiporter
MVFSWASTIRNEYCICGFVPAAEPLSNIIAKPPVLTPAVNGIANSMGGAALVFVPGTPRLELPPELIFALFVAPVLLDAAYDASLRDLRRQWLPVTSLALAAVILTTVSVAAVTR